jgi:hypothetical protein
MGRCRTCGKTWPQHIEACPEDGGAIEPSPADAARAATAPMGASTLASAVTTPGPLGHAATTPGPRVSSPAHAVAPDPDEAGDLAPGTMVGDYEIIGKIGEGGMGTVYSARHPLIDKRAAIKVIRPVLSASAEAVERFIREARAANQIGHPNIVDVFLFGRLLDGRQYYAMELLQGQSLGQRIKSGHMTLPDIADILVPICRALEAAHEKGVIHRDLKPDNVILAEVTGERPRVKLLDFGIAKLARPDETRLERTRTGSMMGTPMYVSPEQARGRRIDARTDIYSLGAMAFEMVLGRPPFLADNAMDIIAGHLNAAPPSPAALWPAIPPALDRLLLEMLDKDPEQRPTLARVRETLESLRTATATPLPEPAVSPVGPITTPRVQPLPLRRKRNWVWLAAGLVAAAAVGALMMRRTPAPAAAPPVAAPQPAQPQPEPTPPPPPPARAGTILVRADVSDARIEVDGRVVAEAADSARVEVPRAGEHEVVATAPGRPPFRKTVTVGDGAEVIVSARLRPPSKRHTEPAAAPAAPATPAKDDDVDIVNPFEKK